MSPLKKLACLIPVAGTVSATPPNVLVLFADDLGQRDLVCYHAESFYETPHLDKLASQGVRFTDGYAASPVCSPTRYALATGRWPTRAGLTNFLPGNRAERFQGAPLARGLPAGDTTVAEALRPAGYHSTYVGKWHLGPKETDWPEHHGFNENVGGFSGGMPGSWFSSYRNPRLKDGPDGEFLTDRLADESIAALRKAKASGKPFFLCHGFYQVHVPLRAPEALVEKYRVKARKLGVADRFGEDAQVHLSAKGPRQVRESQGLPVYAAMVESMDTAAGRILAALDELDLAKNTLVIFSSDNGGLSTAEGSPTSNLPYRGGKGWVYEGGIRVPFIVRWPGVAPVGKVEPMPVTTLDLFPTLLGAAGKTASAPDGRDLAPLLRGESFAERDLFWHYPHYSNQGGFPGGAIRSGAWKLVENYEDGRTSLYDLSKDPGERDDLAAKDTERAAELRAKLHAWYRETGARFLSAKADGPQAWKP